MKRALGQRNGLRILVAEDEPLAAMVLEEALTDFGHTVLLAADGEEALQLAESNPFDVLVTDLAMPRLTGWELIPRLRARRAGLPVVVMTGYLPPGGRGLLLADQGGPLTLLLKPFEIGHLTAAIEQVALRPEAPSQTMPHKALLELN
jgi:CheY-like chemotaxis protein